MFCITSGVRIGFRWVKSRFLFRQRFVCDVLRGHSVGHNDGRRSEEIAGGVLRHAFTAALFVFQSEAILNRIVLNGIAMEPKYNRTVGFGHDRRLH